jgi:hypothetical protein
MFASRFVVPLACAIVAFAAGAVLALAVDDDETRIERAAAVADVPVPAAVPLDGADADADPDDKVIELGPGARDVYQDVADTPERFDLGGGLRGRDETPVAEHEGPLATPNWPGCQTRILPTNWSNRVTSVRGIGLHYTAGGNRPGLSDMIGLTGFASSAAAGVSWHFLIDADGHCFYSVPVSKKAWTIGNLNSQTVNIEVVGTGSERTYPATTAGAAKLRRVVRRIAAVYGLPIQVGATNGACSITRPGIITHWMGGPCSGGHHDIRPYDIARVVRFIATAPCNARCKRIRRQRRVVEGRRRKHARLHERYGELGCRRRMHERRLREYTRPECRRRKRRGHSQHLGITRARKKLARLR